MHRSRLLIVLGAAIAVAALWLPMADLTGPGTINGIDGDGWPAAALLAIVAVAGLLGDRAEGLTMPGAVVAALVVGFAVLFSALKIADAARAVNVAGGSIGSGAWLLAAGGVVALTGVALGLSRRLG